MVACADKDDDAPVFTVTADDSTCDVDSYDATTGNNNFEVTNNGKKITEFFVYTDGGRVVGEVENIGPVPPVSCSSPSPRPAPTRPPVSRAWSAKVSATT